LAKKFARNLAKNLPAIWQKICPQFGKKFARNLAKKFDHNLAKNLPAIWQKN
jgi:hypothetical protein